jgi:hypothetical protein
VNDAAVADPWCRRVWEKLRKHCRCVSLSGNIQFVTIGHHVVGYACIDEPSSWNSSIDAEMLRIAQGVNDGGVARRGPVACWWLDKSPRR